jgi:hypothetical protein
MQPFNYNYNPMMMGQMNFCVNSANPTIKMEKEKIPKKNLIINFIFDGYKIEVQGNSDMTLKKLIELFRVKLCNDNFSLDYFFKRRKLDKDSEETLAQSRISNCDEILVFEQNDKNQEEKLSKMLSHKHDNITITFNASTGNKTQITVGYYTKISKIFNLYNEKLLFGKAKIGEDIRFLYNGSEIQIDDNRTIFELSGNHDSIEITAYDLNGVIGA